MTIDGIQTKVVELLAAAFPSDLVVADYCRKETEAQQEAALAARGICWAVSPLLKATVTSAGGKSAALKATVVARLRTNPTANGKAVTGANKDPLVAIREGIVAVLAWKEVGQSCLMLSDDSDAIELAPEASDSGLLSWDVRFQYQVKI